MVDALPKAIQKWLKSLADSEKSLHTQQAYERGIHHFWEWYTKLYESTFQVDQVMARDIRDWKGHQQREGQVAPATVNQRLSALKQFFNWAHQQKMTPTNPTQDIHLIRLDQHKIKSLKPKQFRRLLRVAKGHHRDFAMLEVLGGTGIRVGELLALCINDVVIQPRSGLLTVHYSKGGGYRDIPLTKDVRQAVQTYLETDHPMPNDATQKLWWGRDGALTHRSSVTRLLEKYAIRAELPRVTPHMLRHIFATRYLNANLDDLRGLAQLLGHSSLDTVMIYTQPHLEDLAHRLEKMETQSVVTYDDD